METEDRSSEMRPRTGIVNLERRKHPRFNVDLPIEYYRVPSSEHFKGRARNASEGGLLVYLPESLEIGQHLRLKVFFSMGTSLDTIDMLTEVVWTDFRAGKDWGDYRSGVRFLDISPKDVDKFGRFLMSLSEPWPKSRTVSR